MTPYIFSFHSYPTVGCWMRMGACAKQMSEPCLACIMCVSWGSMLNFCSNLWELTYTVLNLKKKKTSRQCYNLPIHDIFTKGLHTHAHTHIPPPPKKLRSASKHIKVVKQIKIPMTHNVLKFESVNFAYNT